jgi:LytR cell envelope-related transcriptional attenuator
MSTEPPRTGRPTPSAASSSTVAIVLAVLAALVGFFIIRQVRDDGGSASPPASTAEGSSSSTIGSGELPSSTSPTPTDPPVVTTGTSVQVANASAQNGVAAQLTTALAAEQFTMAAATNSTEKRDATAVYYDAANPAAQPVAATVATMMGVAAAEPLPSPVPVEAGALPEGCGVLVMLGNDKAGTTLADMSAAVTGATTTVAGTATTSATTTATTTA